MRRLVLDLPEPTRRVCGYHFGWLDADGNPDDAGFGKGLRPLVTLLAAEAITTPCEHAVRSAIALEFVHNFSLLHDDVIDRDRTRRGRATAWVVFGENQAVLAGDALLALAFAALPSTRGGGAQLILSDAVQRLVSGQFADVAFETRTDVAVEDYLAMAAQKTGSLFEAACRLGARSGGAGQAREEALVRYGRALGLAFQIADDVSGVWGSKRHRGHKDAQDICSGKKSAPVVAALQDRTSTADELRALYCAGTFGRPASPERVLELLNASGSRDWCEDRLTALRTAARAGLDLAELEPEHASALIAVMDVLSCVD